MQDIGIATSYDRGDFTLLFYHDKCDKYDYLTAIGCGAVAGIGEIFLVGAPGENKILPQWSDTQANHAVMLFAKKCGWSPRAGQENNVRSAIGFLEKHFPVNYDQRHTGDVSGVFNMSTRNHHLKSMAHSPDGIGLFFSILNQFTSTSSFLDNGRLITVQTNTYELQGNNLISKLFCGIANWFGHIMSDMAGSSGSLQRGSGVAIPFFNLFQACNLGSFPVGQDRNTLAIVATKVFQEGYDARFGVAMAIPVLLCDLSIKLIWALKHCFYHKRPLEECIPSKAHDDLRLMLIVGNGVMCLMDGADAVLRSGGNSVAFFMRLNLIAWCRLVILVLREIGIRLGISSSMQKQLNSYIRINAALREYLSQLEQIDIDQFHKESEKYSHMSSAMQQVESEAELNVLLKEEYQSLALKFPYSGDFDSFMKDKSNRLVFE